MIETELEKVRQRNHFYRNSYRAMVSALLLMLLISFVLLGFLAYLVTHRPRPDFYATSSDGRLEALQALSTPVLSTSELLQWAERVAVAAYNYDFVNYRQELQKLEPYFTGGGFSDFQKALQLSGTLERVSTEKLRSTAVATGAPILLAEGEIGGKYAWKVQVPLLVTYETGSGATVQQNLVAEIIIARVSTLDTPKGIAITQFYTKTANPAPEQ